MEYSKGDRVRHPTKPEWGLGEVLENGASGTIRVFFEGAGERTLSLQYVRPKKITGKDATSVQLDNLALNPGKKGIKYKSIAEAREYFLLRYPNGFHGAAFLEAERDYKVKAHELAEEVLAKGRLQRLLEDGDYSEVCASALRAANATNLIFPNEKMALRDGLSTKENQKAFAEQLFELLYGKHDRESAFTSFFSALGNLGTAKWTIATYFPFLVFPAEHIFLKPSVTQSAAALCAFEINYRPELNWVTYASLLKFAANLKSKLDDLKPRDMIDIQSFIWCIAPEV